MNIWVLIIILVALITTTSCWLVDRHRLAHYQPLISSYDKFQAGGTLFSKYGLPAIQTVVDTAATNILNDQILAPHFAILGTAGHRTPGQLEACLDSQFATLFGYFSCYTGVGHGITKTGRTFTRGIDVVARSMKESHRNLPGITQAVFNQFITVLAATLVQCGVTQQDVNSLAPGLVQMASQILTVNA